MIIPSFKRELDFHLILLAASLSEVTRTETPTCRQPSFVVFRVGTGTGNRVYICHAGSERVDRV